MLHKRGGAALLGRTVHCRSDGDTLKYCCCSLAGGAKVNGIKIKKADVSATNGVIHVITGVLTP